MLRTRYLYWLVWWDSCPSAVCVCVCKSVHILLYLCAVSPMITSYLVQITVMGPWRVFLDSWRHCCISRMVHKKTVGCVLKYCCCVLSRVILQSTTEPCFSYDSAACCCSSNHPPPPETNCRKSGSYNSSSSTLGIESPHIMYDLPPVCCVTPAVVPTCQYCTTVQHYYFSIATYRIPGIYLNTTERGRGVWGVGGDNAQFFSNHSLLLPT